MAVAITIAVVALAGCKKKGEQPEKTGHPSPSPTPIPVLPRKNYDVSKLFSQLLLKSSVSCQQTEQTAIAAAANTNSYELDITLHVLWPKAATNIGDLAGATPELPLLLPEMESMLKGVQPSADFATLLANKERSLRSNLSMLQKLPYRDSLFDCQTILNLENGQNSRRALLIQAIMNVNTDGSDGDRNLDIDKLSSTYQPQTNYRWSKTGSHPNPCLREFEARLALLNAEMGNGTMTPEVKSTLEKERGYVKASIEELKRWDFLVGTADPFIVLPSFMVGKSPGQPGIGDYAVVICRGKLYPAIIGDLGPGSKIGEASLRLCREIDPKSGADRRPVNRPEVTYLVFPGTAEKPFSTPDYRHWSDRCHALWKEFGGIDSADWHEWTSLEKPWPTPTPAPTPSPTPATSPSDLPPSPAPTNNPSGTNPAIPDSSTPTTSPTNQPATSILSSTPTNQ
jgi:hypothetical protein